GHVGRTRNTKSCCVSKSGRLLSLTGFRLQGRQFLGSAGVSSKASSEQASKNNRASFRAVTRCRKLFPSQRAGPIAGHLDLAYALRSTPTLSVAGRIQTMRQLFVTACLGVTAMFAVNAQANDELIKLSQDAKQWVLPTGDYANTRYSKLKQINADNVK